MMVEQKKRRTFLTDYIITSQPPVGIPVTGLLHVAVLWLQQISIAVSKALLLINIMLKITKYFVF